MNYNDVLTLRDCIAFSLDNDSDLDQEDVTNLMRINTLLLSQIKEDSNVQIKQIWKNLLG